MSDSHLAPMGSISTRMGLNDSIKLLAFTGHATLTKLQSEAKMYDVIFPQVKEDEKYV